MPKSSNEIPVGNVDGSNINFSTQGGRSYITGTLFPTIQGTKRRPEDDDGIIEVDPAAGTFQTKEVLESWQTFEIEYAYSALDGNGDALVGFIESNEIIGVIE